MRSYGKWWDGKWWDVKGKVLDEPMMLPGCICLEGTRFFVPLRCELSKSLHVMFSSSRLMIQMSFQALVLLQTCF